MQVEKILQHGEYELNELQKTIIETLKVFHDFCQEHGLTYYLGGGTLLGAIRHKGIIPWDDDIDIDMPRDDYEKLINLADKFPKEFIVKHFKLDKDFPHPFIKIYNPKLKVTEFFGNKGYTNGAWIDVFPMDGVISNKILRKIHFFTVKTLHVIYLSKFIGFVPLSENKKNKLITLTKKIAKPTLKVISKPISKKQIFFLMDSLANSKSFDKANFVGVYYSPYGATASFNKDVYKETILVNFNDYKFNSPIGYDEFLKQQYKDYMKLPNKRDRVTHNIKINTNNESSNDKQ